MTRSPGLLPSAAPAAILLFALHAAGVFAAEPTATRMLRSPTVSATQIAFAYAQNIWTVDRAGGAARRLTSFQGQASNPHFSPLLLWLNNLAFFSQHVQRLFHGSGNRHQHV